MQVNLLSAREALHNAATAYIPKIGNLDIQEADEAKDDGGTANPMSAERAAAAHAVRQSMRPDLAFLQRVLDGLRRIPTYTSARSSDYTMSGAQLAQSNFIYRRPDLAERLRHPNADARTQRWSNLISRHHPEAKSVLDLGCWIGVDAERLARYYTVVGVDVQPHLIAYARERRPEPDFVVGDMSSVRLGQRFDAILCVGNSLSYVHRDPDLEATFATFSAHAKEGSLLILHTLMAPVDVLAPTAPQPVEIGDFQAKYADRREWNPMTQVLTTHRTWLYDDGTTEVDVLHRRVLTPPELELRARLAGWDVLSLDFDPPTQDGSAADVTGCMVARFRGERRHHDRR